MTIRENSRYITFESENVILNLTIDYNRNSFDVCSPHQDTLVSIKGNNLSVIRDTVKCLEAIEKYLLINIDLEEYISDKL